MLQSPNEFNQMVQRTFVSKCKFDGGLFSEPLSIMNLLWDFEQVSGGNKKQWCLEKGVSFQRLTRLSSTARNILQRVASFLNIAADNLALECPPRDMPDAKINLLRVIQAWVFHDTMIQCKVKPVSRSSIDVKLLPNSDPVDETILDQIFLKDRHQYVLVDPKAIVQTIICTLSIKSGLDFCQRTETTALSYATEKRISLVWMWLGSQFAVWISRTLVGESCFSVIKQEMEDFLYTPGNLVGRERGGTARGIEERHCGKWTFSIGSEKSEAPCFSKYMTAGNAPKKVLKRVDHLISMMESFMVSNPRFCALSLDASQCNLSKLPRNQTQIVVVSRGSHVHDCSGQDLKDMVGAVGQITVKTKKKKGTPVINFPLSTGTDEEVKTSLLQNTPEALRLLSVMASRRRTHHIVVEVDQVDEELDSTIQVEMFPDKKDTQLTFRWTRFNSDERVFVDENSAVASALPVGWSGTMYCCCANALEIKGGALKAEGLSLLPRSRLFFMLTRLSFGLLRGDPGNEETLQRCVQWISQDSTFVDPVDALQRLKRAALFHSSFDAGEELTCLPTCVESLLDIFDGLDDKRLELWESFSKDPFLSQNRKRLIF